MVQDDKDQVSSNIGSSLFIPVESIKAAQDDGYGRMRTLRFGSKGHKIRRGSAKQMAYQEIEVRVELLRASRKIKGPTQWLKTCLTVSWGLHRQVHQIKALASL